MNSNAADRPNSLHKGLALVALCAAALLLVASGCGQFNDNPDTSGLSVRFAFQGAASPAGTSSPMAIAGPSAGPAVPTVVIGAIVITHANGRSCIGGPICPYTTVTDVTPANRDLLQEDAKQSVVYLEPVDLATATNPVSFQIPPRGAGPWQLVAIGLNTSRTSIADVQSTDPIWYGFTPTFLNGTVLPGQTLGTTLTLKPWCVVDQGPLPDASPPCPAL